MSSAELESPAVKANPIRMFGRFELRQLLGKSAATMTWLAFDPQSGRPVMLSMPRVQPGDPAALERWTLEARMAARLEHPHLAPVAEIGVQDHWPFVVVERSAGQTLPEWQLAHPKPAPLEVVALCCQALEGLAYAHEAGVAHQDLQLHHLLIDETGSLRVAALDIVVEATQAETAFGALQALAEGAARGAARVATALDPGHLRLRRDAAERDVLSMGLLLHHLLVGAPALDEADTGRVIARIAPHGREIVRLPWTTPFPVAEPLRAIVNRATARQARQRYLNARTMLRALDGWRESASQEGGGPLALLIDRLQSVGHLPALPGVGMLAARLASLEGQRTFEMAEPILRDMALSFELLRQVNTAQVQGTQVSGNGPVLTIRRSIALLGVNGVRQAAASLRAWPGPLNEEGAAALKQLMQRVRLAGHTAQALRPPGYDPEVIYLIALLQNLGRLMVQYHFPGEATQIAALMQTVPQEDDEPALRGMSEQDASFAVLGVDIEAIGVAVARHWGLVDEVIHMMRRLPTTRPVRNPDGDADLLRIGASAANEAVDAINLLVPAQVGNGLNAVVQRYGRVLGITQRDLRQGLNDAGEALRGGATGSPPSSQRQAGTRAEADATQEPANVIARDDAVQDEGAELDATAPRTARGGTA
ncbi:MAG: HDOD domain-containing protein [Burkholderiaceae bacterium]|nr:HDOD domain-containing protein [Burkholderiaceae bacterium]